jgi:hypothetical protein
MHALQSVVKAWLLTLLACATRTIQGMEGAAVGIWCAHGEGRAKFPDPGVQRAVLEQGLAPIRCAISCFSTHTSLRCF